MAQRLRDVLRNSACDREMFEPVDATASGLLDVCRLDDYSLASVCRVLLWAICMATRRAIRMVRYI